MVTIYYSYDVDGSLLSMNYNGNEYFYITNLQGDVIELVDMNGNTVAKYKYDAWGNLLDIDGSIASTIGVYNPYRYRGYRYDEEISMYYLNSRFYDANIGRFINADGLIGPIGNTLSHNMYAYTQNNPVMFADPSGSFLVVALIIINIAILIIVIVNKSSNTKSGCSNSSKIYEDGSGKQPNFGIGCEISSSLAEYRTGDQYGVLSGTFEADIAEVEGDARASINIDEFGFELGGSAIVSVLSGEAAGGWDLGFFTINSSVGGYAGGVGSEGKIEFKPTDGKININGGFIALFGFSFKIGIEWGD